MAGEAANVRIAQAGKWASAAIALLLAVGFCYRYLNSPERARNHAVRAFALGNAKTLHQMASRDEIERCRWTEDKIATLLRDAPVRISTNTTPQIKMETDFPVDRRTWSYTYPASGGTNAAKIYVATLHYQGQGWCPLLSLTLRSLYTDGAVYKEKCRQLDIPGIMDEYGEFRPWDEP